MEKKEKNAINFMYIPVILHTLMIFYVLNVYKITPGILCTSCTH